MSLDNFGLLGADAMKCRLFWDEILKKWARAPPQIPPPNESDLNYFQFTLCHAKL